ncbi:hypothetical protein IWQ61_005284, partial [Dispira simplex]
MEDLQSYIQKKKQLAGDEYRSAANASSVSYCRPVSRKTTNKEFEDFINHAQLESSQTNMMQILDGIKDIKAMLSSPQKHIPSSP